MPISLKANSDGSAEILNGVVSAITISPNGNVKASGMQGYNYIINGNFDIWQRGTSQTTMGYGSSDRWYSTHVGSTKTVSRQTFTLGQTDVPGNPKYYMRHNVTSVAGTANHCAVDQRIESVKTLAGQTVTLSFWAKADAPKNIAVELIQYFGSGGTPSTIITGIGSQLVALTTSWAKYTTTVDIPSIVGKTLGTNGNDYLGVAFWFDTGSDYADRTSNLGHQSGTFDIANVSLVEGDIDVKPIPRSYGEELGLCQRYFQRLAHVVTQTSMYSTLRLIQEMRNVPVITSLTFGAGSGAGFQPLNGDNGRHTFYQNSNHSEAHQAFINFDAEL